MNPSSIEILGTVLFGVAVFHTFLVKRFQHISHTFPEGSVGENFFHLLGEVEVVFGFWAGMFLLGMWIITQNHQAPIDYINGTHFTEPAFVFVIMAIAATKPIIFSAQKAIDIFSKILPFSRPVSFYLIALILGPLLGSFITEPAAITVTALILRDTYFKNAVSTKFKYATIALLFVNVSIGGTLTPYAAPPVLMVAGKWGWDMHFMMGHFGWKSAIAIVVSTVLTVLALRKEFLTLKFKSKEDVEIRMPIWVMLVHFVVLASVVLTAHYVAVFMGLFLMFLGIVEVTNEYQDSLKLREALLVGFFLGGLVLFGAQQKWWLDVVLASLNESSLFLGATALTAITDNAALTYLGSQVPNLADAMKQALVSGAVAGGGLTLIANAPNPAGYSILKDSFGEDGFSPMGLLVAAIPPTLIAMASLWFLPNF